MAEFNPKQYWENRLNQNYDLQGVGYINLGKSYNNWLYQVRKVVFNTKILPYLTKNISHAHILDIGSGTGFYIARWKEASGRNVTGCDITSVAVTNLKGKYPDFNFIQADIGDELTNLETNKYDIISAFDVLFHIVDDDRFNKSIKNISNLLKPDGIFILSDNFIHQPTMRAEHQVSRNIEEINKTLSDNGLAIIARIPMFILMNYPIDTSNKLSQLLWRGIAKLVAWNEISGFIIGMLIYPVELLLLSFMKESPTTEIIICQKKS